MSNTELSIHFFLQLTVILAVCRLVGFLAKKIGQPQVVGEMIAGVLMGPSLLGLLWPDVQQHIFPKGPAMSIIYATSQVGLVLYMFLIGVEFDTNLIRQRMRTAVSVSLAGILAPLALGSVVAYFLIGQPGFFSADVVPWQAMLFLGAAISITAFPMLARIIFERGLAGTSLGTLALAAGSTDDAISWCIFAVVLAVFNQEPTIAFLAIGGGLLYALTVLVAVRPALRPLGTMTERKGEISSPVLAFTLMLLMFCAWVTDMIGIYAIFGAFILGIAMPRGLFAKRLQHLLEPIVTNFMLPLFFIYSGLNTSIGLVNSWSLWGITVLVLLVSILGKGVACWFAARLNGEPSRDALAIGALMNARGLMELILLNIGLEHGIITPTLFTMLVFMAIVTTLMASPIFELVYGRHRAKNVAAQAAPVAPGLIPTAHAEA
jgi:Kef-type K+ transport system membrane component KefB